MLVDGEVDPFVKLAGLLHNVPEDQVGALGLPWGAVLLTGLLAAVALLHQPPVWAPPCCQLGAQVTLTPLSFYAYSSTLCSLCCCRRHCLPAGLPQVTAELRGSSKESIYSLLYGMGPARLADRLGITDREAAKLRQALLDALPGVQAWMGRVLEECERTGEHLVTSRQRLSRQLGGKQRPESCASKPGSMCPTSVCPLLQSQS